LGTPRYGGRRDAPYWGKLVSRTVAGVAFLRIDQATIRGREALEEANDVREMGVTIPLEKGGADAIRSLGSVAGGIVTEPHAPDRGRDSSRLWLHVTHAGEERAIYYERTEDHGDGAGRAEKSDRAIVETIERAAWPELWTGQLDVQILYEWDSPDWDENASYQELATSVEIDAQAASSALSEADMLRQISVYTNALNSVGYRHLRTWLQRGPRDRVFLTAYQQAIDVEKAFYAWKEVSVPVDRWARNTLRTMSNDDVELWDKLLSIEPIAAWTTGGVLPLTITDSPQGHSVIVGR
jgi:hypothetical protein